MRLDLFFTQTDGYEDPVWGSDGCDWAVQMRDQLRRSEDAAYRMVDDPERADVIVFWEPHQGSQAIWAPRLRAHRLVREFPNKVFVVSTEDLPLGFLPGLYASLRAPLHHPRRHRTWLFYRTENPYVYSRREDRAVSAPANLAFFSGADSHPLRTRLFELREPFARRRIVVAQTQRGRFARNPGDPSLRQDQLDFVDGILGSRFGLCPRGHGVGTYRLQETLALGRAAVIISDDWVPVAGLDWERFTVFVKERDLADLPAILRGHEDRWREMGAEALRAYRSFFRRETFAVNAMHHVAALYRHRAHDEREFFARWDEMIAEEKRRQEESR